MRKSLLVALIFAACGLLFLAVTGFLYYQSSDAAQQAAADWSITEPLRVDLLTKQNELSALGYVPTPKGAPDIPTILGVMRKDCNIDEMNLKYTSKGGSTTKAGQGEQYGVVIDKISLIDMGKFLGKLRANYPYLKVTDLAATNPTGAGVYKWSLTVVSMSPAGGGGEAAAAAPAEAAEAAESPDTSGAAAVPAKAPSAAVPASSVKAKP